jgi:acyl-CoA reductase-like NAD-dependent aldehyde dehydrogenase
MITDFEKLFIGGKWIASAGDRKLEIRSPHDQSLVGSAPHAVTADIDRAVSAARKAFDEGVWPRTSPVERQTVITRFMELYAAIKDKIADLVTRENGVARWFTGWMVDAMPMQTEAYMRAAKNFGWEERITFGSATTLLRREPIGVVAAIIPWNAPQQSALVKLVPALLAGCTIILKASPETALDALLLSDLFVQAGLPEGVLSILPADRQTSEHLVTHPDVDKIAFTGSAAAGRRIASIAGQQLKRVSLELGGKSASIILDDADLDTMAEALKFLSFANNAESCVAHTRILAPKNRYNDVVERLKTLVESLVIGDPFNPATFIGPMVRADQAKRVRDYIDTGVAEGAHLVTGGSDIPKGLEQGFYVRPTLFSNVTNDMRIARDEIFGPVLAVIPYQYEEEAIRIANDSPYGLSGGVWTKDREHGIEIARQVRTGTFSVNGAPSSFDAPFGGYKASGIGREFGVAGLSQYIEYKSIAI